MIQYLKQTRNKNGFWGGMSPIIETSLALLTLCELNNYFEFDDFRSMIQAGKKYLIAQYRKDGYWNGKNFIKMNLKRAEGGSKYMYYSSSTITTVICLCALKKIDNLNL